MKKLTALLVMLMAISVFGQTSLTVMQGDVIEFHATQVATLEDGDPVPASDFIFYNIHIFYENGESEQLLNNSPMQFPNGTTIIVESDATAKIGTHGIEAWPVRVKPSGAGGMLTIEAEKTILILTVEQDIDNRTPAKWIISIHPKES